VNEIRQLSLVKDDHQFVFRYAAGSEPMVIDTLAELADDPDTAFDWFDAAMLSVQLGRSLELEVDPMPTES
jgi:hypothetical protein